MASIPIHNETDYTLTDDITQQIIRDAQEHFGEEVRAIRVQAGLERHALNGELVCSPIPQTIQKVRDRRRHDMPPFTLTVCADNTCGDGADGLQGPQTPHTRASDRSLVPENCTRRGSYADTHGLALPALLPGGVGSLLPVPANAHRPKAH
jgi:hypothetical protein